MNDLYKPVDVKRLMELAGMKEADDPVNYRANASPEVQANYSKGGQNPDPTDPIIANRMGVNVPQADIARAAQTRPEGPTTSVPTAAAPTSAAPSRSFPAPAAPAAAPAATTPAPIRTNPAPVTRPAYAGSAGSQAIQKLNPDLIKDVNKIYPGQQFKLPSGGTYTVKKGDTLDAIARNAAAPAARPAAPAATPAAQQPFNLQLPYTHNTPTPPSLRTNPAAPAAPAATTPASRSAISGRIRANQQVRETSADLGRMQNLAGIRKN